MKNDTIDSIFYRERILYKKKKTERIKLSIYTYIYIYIFRDRYKLEELRN